MRGWFGGWVVHRRHQEAQEALVAVNVALKGGAKFLNFSLAPQPVEFLVSGFLRMRSAQGTQDVRME